jgi:hypothetical protein
MIAFDDWEMLLIQTADVESNAARDVIRALPVEILQLPLLRPASDQGGRLKDGGRKDNPSAVEWKGGRESSQTS